MTTMENAAAAYAGESQANRKYSNFSEKAESEGFPMVAKLFKAASEAEARQAGSQELPHCIYDNTHGQTLGPRP